MIFENLEVIHKSFGLGKIIEKKGQYLTVKFDAVQKIFVYPDIFEKFLTLADGTVNDEINADLEASKAAKKKILDSKEEENIRAMTRGIVIPGKENLNSETDEEEAKYKNSENEEI